MGLNTSRESCMQVVKSLVKDTASLGLHNLHVDYVDEVRVASPHLLLHIYHTPHSRPHSVKHRGLPTFPDHTTRDVEGCCLPWVALMISTGPYLTDTSVHRGVYKYVYM